LEKQKPKTMTLFKVVVTETQERRDFFCLQDAQVWMKHFQESSDLELELTEYQAEI
jgi:hypothetical protein